MFFQMQVTILSDRRWSGHFSSVASNCLSSAAEAVVARVMAQREDAVLVCDASHPHRAVIKYHYTREGLESPMIVGRKSRAHARPKETV